MSKAAIGWILIVIGGVAMVVSFIKVAIIGYYPDEAVLFFGLMLVGVIAMWVGDRFRRQSVIDAGGDDND